MGITRRRKQKARAGFSKGNFIVDIGLGERPWTTHIFELKRGIFYNFLAREMKDGKIEVAMVRENQRTKTFRKEGGFVVSKDLYDEIVEQVARGIFKDARREVLYPQHIVEGELVHYG